jgi:hypothetical protein
VRKYVEKNYAYISFSAIFSLTTDLGLLYTYQHIIKKAPALNIIVRWAWLKQSVNVTDERLLALLTSGLMP